MFVFFDFSTIFTFRMVSQSANLIVERTNGIFEHLCLTIFHGFTTSTNVGNPTNWITISRHLCQWRRWVSGKWLISQNEIGRNINHSYCLSVDVIDDDHFAMSGKGTYGMQSFSMPQGICGDVKCSFSKKGHLDFHGILDWGLYGKVEFEVHVHLDLQDDSLDGPKVQRELRGVYWRPPRATSTGEEASIPPSGTMLWRKPCG